MSCGRKVNEQKVAWPQEEHSPAVTDSVRAYECVLLSMLLIIKIDLLSGLSLPWELRIRFPRLVAAVAGK